MEQIIKSLLETDAYKFSMGQAIYSIQAIKRNKRIKLYICYKNLSDSEIPSDKVVLNKYDEGIILADKDYEKESMDFHSCMNSFAEYEQLYQNIKKKE